MAEGKLAGDLMITGRIGLDNFLPDVLEPVIKHKEDNVKILVSPD